MKRIQFFLCLMFMAIFHSPIVKAQNIKTVAGNGVAGFNSDNISPLTAQLNKPNTLSFDGAGNLYIADCSNNRIRKVSTSGIITTVAGSGAPGYSGDGGPATAADLQYISSIISDLAGNLYISFGSNRIRRVSNTGIITTIAGTGTAGYNGDNVPATSSQLFYPYVGSIDNTGDLYFSDYGNHRVRKINTAGIITTVAGDGSAGSGGDGLPATSAQLNGPTWPFVTSTGDLYIPDNLERKIRKVDASTSIISTFAGTGITGNTGDGGPAVTATLTYPNGITFDKTGNAYIADYGAGVVRKINTAGFISTIAGTGTPGYGGDGGPAILAQITPNTLTCDAADNVYIADLDNNRIRMISYNSTEVKEQNIGRSPMVIYPNPARDKLIITEAGKGEPITISNAIGQTIYNCSPMADKTVINTTGFAVGFYFVKVNGVYAGKFVKE